MNQKIHYLTLKSDYSKDILEKIENIEWNAGKHLANRIKTKDLDENDVVIVMTDNEDLMGFVSFVKRDTVAVTDFGPFIATMYVSPDYRGKGLSLDLGKRALQIAEEKNTKEIYILTRHIGLYEKLGFEEVGHIKDKFDRDMRVLRKSI